jgi:hypothetical protein
VLSVEAVKRPPPPTLVDSVCRVRCGGCILEKNHSMARVTCATLHTQATVAITRVVINLQEVLGQRLTAVVTGTKDARTLRAWAQGQRSPSEEAERRLRDAYAVVDLLLEVEAPETVRAWFCGMNPNLDDRPPVLALVTMPQEVLQAARAFVANG